MFEFPNFQDAYLRSGNSYVSPFSDQCPSKTEQVYPWSGAQLRPMRQ